MLMVTLRVRIVLRLSCAGPRCRLLRGPGLIAARPGVASRPPSAAPESSLSPGREEVLGGVERHRWAVVADPSDCGARGELGLGVAELGESGIGELGPDAVVDVVAIAPARPDQGGARS